MTSSFAMPMVFKQHMQRFRGRSFYFIAETIFIVGVLLGAFFVLGDSAERLEFSPHEKRYILRAPYFGYLFLQRDLARPEWRDSVSTHTQPMLGNYLVGAALWVGGYDLENLPPPYDRSKSFDENRMLGAVPDDRMLAYARAPMVVIAALGVLILYLLARILGGKLAGLTAAGLVLTSEFTHENLVQAQSDIPLAMFILLALLLCTIGVRRGRTGALPVRWAVLIGIALGLAMGSKLTALLSLAALVIWASVVMVLAFRQNRTSLWTNRLGDAWLAGRGWVIAMGLALASSSSVIRTSTPIQSFIRPIYSSSAAERC